MNTFKRYVPGSPSEDGPLCQEVWNLVVEHGMYRSRLGDLAVNLAFDHNVDDWVLWSRVADLAVCMDVSESYAALLRLALELAGRPPR